MRRIITAIGLALSLHCSLAAAQVTEVIYPAGEIADDKRFLDLLEILRVALDKTVAEFGPYRLQASSISMTEARYLEELKRGNKVNIIWSSTSEEKEQELLPLKIPLRKGLLGYRIAFIAKDKQAKIDRVQTLADLQQLTIGQGIGWGDVALYRFNHIAVTTSSYKNLFKMTNSGRFDLFPRGIGEIFGEYEQHGKSEPNLAIENNLLIYYPWPYYFFFNRNNAALKNRVESGIRKMMADGSFDAIFKKYNGEAIQKARLKERRVIKIKNHLLPKETPLDDPKLWFDPAKY